jgi:hypothetical protein
MDPRLEDDWVIIKEKHSSKMVEVRLKNYVWDQIQDRLRKEGKALEEWVSSCIEHELLARGVFEKVRRIFERHLEDVGAKRTYCTCDKKK